MGGAGLIALERGEFFELSGGFYYQGSLTGLLGGCVGDDSAAVSLIIVILLHHAVGENEPGFGDGFAYVSAEGILRRLGQSSDAHLDVFN